MLLTGTEIIGPKLNAEMPIAESELSIGWPAAPILAVTPQVSLILWRTIKIIEREKNVGSWLTFISHNDAG